MTAYDAIYTSKASMEDTCMFLAHSIAQLRSKDPRTKVGCCIYDPQSGGYYLGFNGFPSGFPDYQRYWDNRDSATEFNKYLFVVHAETNALRKAKEAVGDLSACSMFITHFPCRVCTKDSIMMSGIKKVYYASKEHYDPMSEHMAAYKSIQLIHRPLPKLSVVIE